VQAELLQRHQAGQCCRHLAEVAAGQLKAGEAGEGRQGLQALRLIQAALHQPGAVQPGQPAQLLGLLLGLLLEIQNAHC